MESIELRPFCVVVNRQMDNKFVMSQIFLNSSFLLRWMISGNSSLIKMPETIPYLALSAEI